MNNRKSVRICNKAIMKMNAERPMTDRERKFDLIYGIVLAILLVGVPLVTLPWLLTVNRPWTALIVNVISIGLFLIIGISRRRLILRKFHMVENADSYVEVREDPDMAAMKKIIPVLVFPIPNDPVYLDLLYNWLCWRQLIQPREKLTVWHIMGAQLAPYLKVKADADIDVMLVPLEGRMPDDWRRLKMEMSIMGMQQLYDIAK